MRFGFFDQLPCPSGFSEPQRYRDFTAQIELGDALGFDTAWLGEIHFNRAFSILADPLMVLAAAAQRTTRIRLGTAVTLLPLHNPIKIAEEAATADILSNGRLEFGVGRGVAYQYPGYGIPLEESRERFEEALDFIVQAWMNEPFSFEGKFFRARDLSVVPKPLQSPHPPVRVAANSPDTFPFSGRRKLPIFASPIANPKTPAPAISGAVSMPSRDSTIRAAITPTKIPKAARSSGSMVCRREPGADSLSSSVPGSFGPAPTPCRLRSIASWHSTQAT